MHWLVAVFLLTSALAVLAEIEFVVVGQAQSGVFSYAFDGTSFTASSPQPDLFTGKGGFSVAFDGRETWLMVGQQGVARQNDTGGLSSFASPWERLPAGFVDSMSYLSGVGYSLREQCWLVGGADVPLRQFAFSMSNGTFWEEASGSFAARANDVVYLERYQRWVAIGGSGLTFASISSSCRGPFLSTNSSGLFGTGGADTRGFGVAYSAPLDLVVAVGGDGSSGVSVIYSPNGGLSWLAGEHIFPNGGRDVSWGGVTINGTEPGFFLAVGMAGGQGAAYSSQLGLSGWSSLPSFITSSFESLSGVAYSVSLEKWVLVGKAVAGFNHLAISQGSRDPVSAVWTLVGLPGLVEARGVAARMSSPQLFAGPTLPPQVFGVGDVVTDSFFPGDVVFLGGSILMVSAGTTASVTGITTIEGGSLVVTGVKASGTLTVLSSSILTGRFDSLNVTSSDACVVSSVESVTYLPTSLFVTVMVTSVCDGLSTGVIVGIVVGCACLAAAIVVVLVILMKRSLVTHTRKENKRIHDDTLRAMVMHNVP